MRVGVISINPKITDHIGSLDFDTLYKAVGMNTGNLMFTTAMYRQLDADVKHIEFVFPPHIVNTSFDAVVIPAANWLNMNDNWDWLSDQIEKLEIPVITIGIGLQANSVDLENIKINASSERLIRTLSRKSAFISTRGNLTTRYLQSIGVMNVVTTGCPSIYMPVHPENNGQIDPSSTVLQSTRYYYSTAAAQKLDLNNLLFLSAGRYDYDMVYQSEPEEMEYILGRGGDIALNQERLSHMGGLYGFDSIDKLKSYLDRKGSVFFNIDEWANYLVTKGRLLGTRLHGAILSLNSGRPSILLAHDSRTSEMIDFAGIPTISPEFFNGDFSPEKVNQAFDRINIDAYKSRREENRIIYHQFLAANGLKPIISEF